VSPKPKPAVVSFGIEAAVPNDRMMTSRRLHLVVAFVLLSYAFWFEAVVQYVALLFSTK